MAPLAPRRSSLTSRDALFAAAGLGALAIFSGAAAAVSTGRAESFDRAAFASLQRLASPFTDAAMRTITLGGSFPVVLAVVLLVAGLRLRRGAGWPAFQLGAVAAVEEIGNLLLKQAFHRLRPVHAQLDSFSFPSGHAMSAVAVYGTLGVLIARAHPRLRWHAAALAMVLPALVGISRVYLGLHWASDVVAGAAAGAVVLVVAARATRAGVDRREFVVRSGRAPDAAPRLDPPRVG